ncbi:MAG: hypothetical protein SPE65_00525, partial [Muribaculaceae bacterium]|nr:hypothetical protein [Muribaculaceae bacterium]
SSCRDTPLKHSNIHPTTMEATAPHRLRGAIWWNARRTVPACRHDPAWRNTGLRTDATPPGWRITSPFVIGSAATAPSASRSSAAQSPSPLLCDASIAIAATRLTYSQPAITQLCRGSTVSTMCVPTIRPCRPPAYYRCIRLDAKVARKS